MNISSTPRSGRTKPVGLLFPRSGPLALHGQPALDAALLAIDEINRAGGLLGNQLDPVTRDPGQTPADFADCVRSLASSRVAAIFGLPSSSARRAATSVLAAHDLLLWSCALHEGLDPSPQTIACGPCLNQILSPTLDWVFDHGGHRLVVVSADDLLPQMAGRFVRSLIESRSPDIRLLAEHRVDSRASNCDAIAQAIGRALPDAVFSALNDIRTLDLFRACQAAGIDPAQIPIVALGLTEIETALLGTTARGHLGCAPYYQTVNHSENRQFLTSFQDRYGPNRPVAAPMALAYSQVHLWGTVVETARSFATADMRRHLAGRSFTGPAGRLTLQPNRHATLEVHVAQAESEDRFRILWSGSDSLAPLPWLGLEKDPPPHAAWILEGLAVYASTLDRDTQRSPATEPQPAATSSPSGQNPTPTSVEPPLPILIVEDDPISQLVVTQLLNKLGYQASLAKNGRLAVTAAEATAFALILMDCQMPEMDGFEATRRIRAREKTANRRPALILALTAHRTAADQAQCLASGMDGCLFKPVPVQDLREAIDRATTLTLTPPPTPAPAPDLHPAPSDGVDLDRLLEITNGNQEQMHEVVALFLAQAEQGLETIRIALNEKDSENALRTARKLAGAALNSGLNNLVPHLSEFKTAIENCNWPEATRQLDCAGAALRTLRQRFLFYKPQGEAPAPAIVPAPTGRPASSLPPGPPVPPSPQRAIRPESPSAPLPPPSQANSNAPLIDIDRLQELAEGDPTRLQEFVRIYLAQADQVLIDLRSALERSAAPDVARLAHKLLGASASCGIDCLVAPLRTLESMGRSADLQTAPPLIDQVASQLESVRHLLTPSNHLRPQPAPSGSPNPQMVP
jgi:ABC-type branched-subunit amino acid transport system substrate-binding protein/CheY-like chemotaxis protein/HPt (histidine-containing phosphotransfer) domain-containing protein